MANERKICVILGSAPVEGDCIPEDLCAKDAYLICADGGVDTAARLGLHPDLIVGDFDSLEGELPQDVETIHLPVEKDETDLLYGVKEGFRRGYNQFVLLGALGGPRFDHSIASLCVLSYIADRGGRGVLADGRTRVFVLSSGRLVFTDLKGSTLSVFPFGGDTCRVTYKGLQYPLLDYTLQLNDALGGSNSIVEDRAEVLLHQGRALVILLEAEAP